MNEEKIPDKAHSITCEIVTLAAVGEDKKYAVRFTLDGKWVFPGGLAGHLAFDNKKQIADWFESTISEMLIPLDEAKA